MRPLLFLLVIVGSGHSVHHPNVEYLSGRFSYDVKDLVNGPLAWGGECQRGTKQSPIDVRYPENGIIGGGKKAKIWFSNQYGQTQGVFYFANTGHTLQIQLSGNIMDPRSTLAVADSGLNHGYIFSQLHFHWGDRDEVGSEHTIQGQRFPAEIHLVHYKAKYANLSHALSDNTNDSQAVMVFAIFCELGNHNPALHPIIDAAGFISKKNPSLRLTSSNYPINFRKLLPKRLDFVRYHGSLTTPPCTEKVVWAVFVCPIRISRKQLETVRRLRDPNGKEFYNYRPLQKRNGRNLEYIKVDGNDGKSTLGDCHCKKDIFQGLANTLEVMNSALQNFIQEVEEKQEMCYTNANKGTTSVTPRNLVFLDK